MGFFSDLKEDLSQAVDELMPNEESKGTADGNHMMTQEEIMAAFAAAAEAEENIQESQTAEEETADVSDISLEEMLKNIDSIAFPETEEPAAAEESVPEADITAETTETDAATAEDPGDAQSLEEMLAAAIAALPEEEIAEAVPTEAVAEALPEDHFETEVSAEEIAAEPEFTMDVMAQFMEADGTEMNVEESAEAEPEAVSDAVSDAASAEDADYDAGQGLTVYETLIPEEVIPDELVIEEPVIEESQSPEKFHRELIAGMPMLDDIPEQETGEDDFLQEAEEVISEESAEVVPEEPVPELNIEKTAKEMTYVTEGTSVIAAGMNICGDLLADSPVSVMGVIEGNVEVNGKLSVGGQIHGNVRASEIYAEGAKLTGDIVSEGAVKLGAKSVIIGNILANSAAIAGAVKGDIDVHGPIILDSTAIVVGNIKFKSIQINNGAVIEGMCLQCYADINPTSFFDAV